MVSFVILLVARTARIAWRTDRQTDRQNDKPSTVTLAAHARRGLTRLISKSGQKGRVHLGPNVSSSAHDCGRMVNGGGTFAAI